MNMFTDITSNFCENAADVEKLVDFDRNVVDVMLNSLDGLRRDLPPQNHAIVSKINRVSQIVTGIRDNESLKSRYGVICNQAVVLLVSHFASALGDIFRTAVTETLDRDDNKALLDEEMKLTFREMKEREWNLKGSAAELLIAKKDLTFQDMQSTVRAFESYVGVTIVKDKRVNNIILGQAARHVIVHTGGRITEKMKKQVAKADPRSLKTDLVVDSELIFSKNEVSELKSEMVEFVLGVVSLIEARNSG